MKPRRPPPYERYTFADSPWRQNLTQRNLAVLLGTTKGRLESVIRNKDRWVRKRDEIIGGKTRRLAVPIGQLRSIHERLKFHLNKVKQPDYLFSPRKGRSQRDNAVFHRGQRQYLSIDVRQFYPETTAEDIFRWAHHRAGLRADVAGMLVHLTAVDGRLPFGSPVSPVLAALVHQEMFDAVYDACQRTGLKMSLWVDDIVISGEAIPGTLLEEIRALIRAGGFNTHKIHFRTGNRPVLVTGVPVVRGDVVAPRWLHRRIEDGYNRLRGDLSDHARERAIDQLLADLGNYRYYVGSSSREGRKAADRMNALRTRRGLLQPSFITPATAAASEAPAVANSKVEVAPWE